MQTNPQYSDNPEIDLTQISRMMGRTKDRFASGVYRGMLFVKRNAVVLLILLIVGGVVGYFLDREKTVYGQEIIVTTNFKSADYLYSKITLLNSKILENDTIFFKNIGINDFENILKIEITPIVDIYRFVGEEDHNFELLKLMAEDGDLKKIMVDNATGKNYRNHLIKIQTLGYANYNRLITPILEYLNKSNFFDEVQKISIKNLQIQIAQNDIMIGQIDTILNSFTKNSQRKTNSDKLVYYSDNNQLHELLKTKETILKENSIAKLDLMLSDKIIKENTTTLNNKAKVNIYNKMKFILPLILIVLFLLITYCISFYRKQTLKYNESLA